MITSLDNGNRQFSFIHFYVYFYLPETKKKGMTNCLEKNVIEERTKHPFTTYFTIFACKSCVIQKSIKKSIKFSQSKSFFLLPFCKFLPIIVRHNEIINKSSAGYLNQLRKLFIVMNVSFFFFFLHSINS